MKSEQFPNYGLTIRCFDPKCDAGANILYLPIVYLLDIGIEDLNLLFDGNPFLLNVDYKEIEVLLFVHGPRGSFARAPPTIM